ASCPGAAARAARCGPPPRDVSRSVSSGARPESPERAAGASPRRPGARAGGSRGGRDVLRVGWDLQPHRARDGRAAARAKARARRGDQGGGGGDGEPGLHSPDRGRAPGARARRGGASGRRGSRPGVRGRRASPGVTEPPAAHPSPVAEHKAHAPARVRCVVCTVSDSKTPATDTSGQLIRELLANAGHEVVDHVLVRDEPSQVHAVIHRACTRPDVQAVIFTGGTGIAPRDQTFEAIDALLEKRLPGFGELFRLLSYQEIGSAAMLSRAQAGIPAGRAVFSPPGAPPPRPPRAARAGLPPP